MAAFVAPAPVGTITRCAERHAARPTPPTPPLLSVRVLPRTVPAETCSAFARAARSVFFGVRPASRVDAAADATPYRLRVTGAVRRAAWRATGGGDGRPERRRADSTRVGDEARRAQSRTATNAADDVGGDGNAEQRRRLSRTRRADSDASADNIDLDRGTGGGVSGFLRRFLLRRLRRRLERIEALTAAPSRDPDDKRQRVRPDGTQRETFDDIDASASQTDGAFRNDIDYLDDELSAGGDNDDGDDDGSGRTQRDPDAAATDQTALARFLRESRDKIRHDDGDDDELRALVYGDDYTSLSESESAASSPTDRSASRRRTDSASASASSTSSPSVPSSTSASASSSSPPSFSAAPPAARSLFDERSMAKRRARASRGLGPPPGRENDLDEAGQENIGLAAVVTIALLVGGKLVWKALAFVFTFSFSFFAIFALSAFIFVVFSVLT